MLIVISIHFCRSILPISVIDKRRGAATADFFATAALPIALIGDLVTD